MLRFLTSGESHGQCLNVILDGFPANVNVDIDFINSEMKRRQIGYGRGGRMQKEPDKVLIKSGVRLGLTTGAPICLEIANLDWENKKDMMSIFPTENENAVNSGKITKVRPGHADFAGSVKYNQKDVRNILERASARETAARVAVGAFAKTLLSNFGIKGFSHVIQIGDVKINENTVISAEIAEKSELRCCDIEACEKMKKEIDLASEKGYSLGGKIEVIFKNIPAGLGSHVQWDRKLDGEIAGAVMSIPAVKAVEIGAGVEAAQMHGNDFHDELFCENGKIFRKTNNAGGLEGGITNGESLIVKLTMKAIPTMKTPLATVDIETLEPVKAHYERADVCAVPACGVVAESMIALVLANAFTEKFGSDSLEQIKRNFENE